MNILHSQSMKPYLNRFWSLLKGSWVAPFMTHEAQGLSALCLLKQFPQDVGRMFAQGWYDRPLRGAAPGWESRYPLPYDPTGTIDVDLTGANSADMVVADFCTALEIGVGFTVAGTVTKLVMDFDLYPTMADAVGTVVDKLDTVNGVITAALVADQAISNIIYKDLGHTVGGIDINKGSSVRALVTTPLTAGEGVPYCLVIPRAMNNANISTMIASA